MNEQTISGISVCVMYALLILACFAFVDSGFTTDRDTQILVLALPVWVQYAIAEPIGLLPLLRWIGGWTHCAAPYAITVLTSFYALYWIGWWIPRIDE